MIHYQSTIHHHHHITHISKKNIQTFHYTFHYKRMRQNRPIKGDFVLPIPSLTFHHRHLSLDKQRKDREIKREREQLEKKRKQFEQTKSKWTNEQTQFRQYSAKRREQNISLVLKEEKLKIDLFRLSIRKDQIQSRTNQLITLKKANIIKSYLRCVSYTAGKRLQSIKFWKSEARYNQLRFLLQLAVDRYFGRSPIQQRIISNLSRTVFCKKLQFQGQWVMVCIKQPQESSSNCCYRTCKKSHRSIYHPQNSTKQKQLELIVYAIAGQYFYISKLYPQQQLKEWVETQQTHTIISKQNINTHRLSVADNLAKLNALKELSEQVLKSPQMFTDKTRKESTNSFEDERFIIISEEEVASSINTEQNQQTLEDLTTPQIQNKKKNSNEESESSKDPTYQNLSDANESEGQSQNINQKTKKSMISKSTFYIKGKNETYIGRFNRQFPSGIQEVLFPPQNPILNVVILKQKREIYFLREYIEIASKKLILDKAVARFRLKMKIKAERKKCLYYNIATVTTCYQTVMGKEQSISLPCLFVLKGQETADAHQMYIYCHSIITHPKIQNGLNIKALLHQAPKEKEQHRQNKTGRNSNIKNIKSGSQRRSRESKKKHNVKNFSKNLTIQQQHQKSGFGSAKKKIEPWVAFSPQIIQKYQKFMENHIISIQSKKFLTRQWVKDRIFGIIRIQNKIRSIISKRHLKQAKQKSRFKCKWKQNTKVLITAVLNTDHKNIKVYIEKVDYGNSEPLRSAQYSEQNWDAICNSIQNAQNQGDFMHISNSLLHNIEEKIILQAQRKVQLELQKPQKYKKMIRDFFFLIKIKNKVKNNIYFVKKMIIRERTFVLLIRRDKYVKSLLQCNLYDLILQKGNQESKQTKNSETAFSKQQRQVGSQYGSHKPASRSKPELDDKIYRYQKIYLMEQYFQGIDSKRIIDQFYIQKGAFLLKPPRSLDVYYIQRLNTLDMNSEQFGKQFLVYEKQEYSLKKNEDRLSLNVSNKSLKRLIHQKTSDNDKSQTQSRELLNLSKLRAKKEPKQNRKKEKKTSIQNNERELMTFLKSNFMRQKLHNMQMISKKSFGQSNSGKAGRQIYQIKNNSHESTVYYSLYKCQNVFFNLQFFIVQKTVHQNTYQETLVSIQKYRIYKKQLQQPSSSLFYKKLAGWAHQNDDLFIRSHDHSKDKSQQTYKKEESVSNLVTLQFFNALISGNKRFSQQILNTITSEKGSRTNTLTL